jgi:hypothetical protein
MIFPVSFGRLERELDKNGVSAEVPVLTRRFANFIIYCTRSVPLSQSSCLYFHPLTISDKMNVSEKCYILRPELEVAKLHAGGAVELYWGSASALEFRIITKHKFYFL